MDDEQAPIAGTTGFITKKNAGGMAPARKKSLKPQEYPIVG
jgi:hypothetical protein